MIDRETVLHVAMLARLELSEDEVERMTTELAGVLEHIETIAELDLEGVAPTTHVVAVENALRADEPTPCLSREQALASAPGDDEPRESLPREQVLAAAPAVADDGFAVPSPQA